MQGDPPGVGCRHGSVPASLYTYIHRAGKGLPVEEMGRGTWMLGPYPGAAAETRLTLSARKASQASTWPSTSSHCLFPGIRSGCQFRIRTVQTSGSTFSRPHPSLCTAPLLFAKPSTSSPLRHHLPLSHAEPARCPWMRNVFSVAVSTLAVLS